MISEAEIQRLRTEIEELNDERAEYRRQLRGLREALEAQNSWAMHGRFEPCPYCADELPCTTYERLQERMRFACVGAIGLGRRTEVARAALAGVEAQEDKPNDA